MHYYINRGSATCCYKGGDGCEYLSGTLVAWQEEGCSKVFHHACQTTYMELKNMIAPACKGEFRMCVDHVGCACGFEHR